MSEGEVKLRPGKLAVGLMSAQGLVLALLYFRHGWQTLVPAILIGLMSGWVGINYGRRWMEAHGLDPDNLPMQREGEASSVPATENAGGGVSSAEAKANDARQGEASSVPATENAGGGVSSAEAKANDARQTGGKRE